MSRKKQPHRFGTFNVKNIRVTSWRIETHDTDYDERHIFTDEDLENQYAECAKGKRQRRRDTGSQSSTG
jgi:hypothetical protein